VKKPGKAGTTEPKNKQSPARFVLPAGFEMFVDPQNLQAITGLVTGTL
jgi:hypothetical protein